MTKLAVVILAAGHGTRMISQKNKVLHEVGGSPMIELAVESSIAVSDVPPVVVVSPYDTDVRSLIGDRVVYVEQEQQMGTGHATMMAADDLRGISEQVLVTYADMPLLRPETMARLAVKQKTNDAAVAILVVTGDPASSFGRVITNPEGHVVEIVEVAEARRLANAEELLQIRDHNAGVYCFDSEWLWSNITALPLRQARDNEEYYLTDMVGLAVSQGLLVEAIAVDDPDECLGAGTRQELAVVESAMKRRINKEWMDSGVTILDPEVTYIDKTVTIGKDTILRPNTYLQGTTRIGANCLVGPNATIRNSQIGDGCRIEQAIVENATIDEGTLLEPFSLIQG